MNANISNKLIFSYVCRSINYIESPSKLKLVSSEFILFARHLCSLHFDKPQKNKIHSLKYGRDSFSFRVPVSCLEYHAEVTCYDDSVCYQRFCCKMEFAVIKKLDFDPSKA